MANLKCHMPIMVNVAVYAMRFATELTLPHELSFEVGVIGTLEGIRENAMQFATGPEFPRNCPLSGGRGTLEGIRGKFGVGYNAFLRLSGWQI